MEKQNTAAKTEEGESYTTGFCRCCGEENHTGFQSFPTQEEANDYVTAQCDCPGATRERNKKEEQKKYNQLVEEVIAKRKWKAEQRAEIAEKTLETIEELFGTGAEARGVISLDGEVLTCIGGVAMLVYDGLLKDCTLTVAENVKCKLTNRKGALSIERADASKQKQEVL